MSVERRELTLYAITDGERTTCEQVELAIRGGATIVQIREKNITHDEYVLRARQMKAVCDRYRVKLIVNDDVSVALESGADGVHVGAEDAPVDRIRGMVSEYALAKGMTSGQAKALAQKFIVGATAKTSGQAISAERSGADYLGCGAVFVSPTKKNAIRITEERLAEIVSGVRIPVVAIGGINARNAASLRGCGISGIAVVSAIFGSDDVFSAAVALKDVAREVIG